MCGKDREAGGERDIMWEAFSQLINRVHRSIAAIK